MAARLGLVLALLSVPACVTQNIQFEPPLNYPPSIELSADDSPLIRLDLLEGAGDAGTSADTDIVLDVMVRDPNVDDALSYRVFRNFNPLTVGEVPMLIDADEIPGDGESVERPLRVVLDRALIPNRPCNRIELFVTSGFQPPPALRDPAIPGDLAVRTWFVVTDGSVGIEACAPWFHGQ